MDFHRPRTLLLTVPVLAMLASGCNREQKEIERPERIVSKRIVLYDDATYQKLADAWHRYYDVYPSEDAYANWMYAARYADDQKYEDLLENGVSRYAANPTLQYLFGLTKLGAPDSTEARHLLERAASLDPGYSDPWYGLIDVYMREGDRERTDAALRHLLETGAIADEVMDFSYNMLACLEQNAILITNGDNDTYPGWILTRIVGFRPDVQIVNRSLLNTEWYPRMVIREGVPPFVTDESLTELRKSILEEMKEKAAQIPTGGPFGDTLIVRLIEAGARGNRPVYFTCTLMGTAMVDRYEEGGTRLGLVTLVTASTTPSAQHIRAVLDTWLKGFRTGGLDSWQLRHAEDSRAGKRLIINYAAALRSLLPSVLAIRPDYRLSLFRWYKAHLQDAVPRNAVEEANRIWCTRGNPPEIEEWCRKLGYTP